MITTQEFDTVSQLAGLEIPTDRQEAFRQKIDQVIDLIEPLRTLDIDQMRQELWVEIHTSSTLSQFPQYDDTHTPPQMDRNIFLSNIHHPVINDSIVIKSSLSQSDS